MPELCAGLLFIYLAEYERYFRDSCEDEARNGLPQDASVSCIAITGTALAVCASQHEAAVVNRFQACADC